MAETKASAPQKTAESAKIVKPAAASESAAPSQPSVAQEAPAPKPTRSRKKTTDAPPATLENPLQSKAETPQSTLKDKQAVPKQAAHVQKAESTAAGPAPIKPEEKPKQAIPQEKAEANPSPKPSLSDAEIEQMIAEAAYYLAAKRNFAPGFEDEDWATATDEVMARIKNG